MKHLYEFKLNKENKIKDFSIAKANLEEVFL